MGTIANAKVTHYYNCYNGDFIGCLQFLFLLANIRNIYQIDNQSVVFLLSILQRFYWISSIPKTI